MIKSICLQLNLTGIFQVLCVLSAVIPAADLSAQDIEFVSMFGSFGDGVGQFSQPTAVAVDNQGQIFIAERNNHRFQICDYQGNCAQFGKFGSGQGEFGDPQGIEVDSQGRILAAEAEVNSRIQILDQQGNWISFLGGGSDGEGAFAVPAGLTVDSENRIIITELDVHRVEICSYEGECSGFGGRLPGSTVGLFNFPRGITVDHQGRIVVADWGNHRIQVCDYQGDCFAFGSLGSEPGQFNNPAGVAVDSLNRIIVADRDNHRIQICDELGDCQVFGTFETGPGQFRRPLGITVDSKDRIIVAERDNHRVQIPQITDTGVGFQINAAKSDAWFFPDTSGQGFFIIVWEDQKLVFLAWFTYDTDRPPQDVTALLGEPGHRWLTALGPYEGDTALLDVFLSSGMVFDSAEPAVTTEQLEGATIEIVWSSCEEGVVKYDIPSLGLSGEIPIQRIVLDNVPLCETLATNP